MDDKREKDARARITSDVAARNLKPRDKLYRVPCITGGGLCLEVTPGGGKLWRLRYRFSGVAKMLSLGAFPAVGLADARQRRDEAKKLLASGVDPSTAKKSQKLATAERAANSFESIGLEWFELMRSGGKWSSDQHAVKVKRWLEKDTFPWLAARPVAEITPSEVLAVLRRIEARCPGDTAGRVKGYISNVMCYAIATGRAEYDPCSGLRGALRTPVKRHFAAFTNPADIAGLMRALQCHKGTLVVRNALLLSPLVFVRPGELRKAKWADVDLETKSWCFRASKTKGGSDPVEHVVPLSRQAVALLAELQPLTGGGEYVFPNLRDKKRPMSDAAVNAALRTLGYDTKAQQTGHGFRAMARTVLAEVLEQDAQVIERQLAHKPDGPLKAAYNRTRYIKQRIPMMQAWADYLDKLKAEG